MHAQGQIQRSGKQGALYVNHHGWPTKKIVGFRWSKKAKITLETMTPWQNISIIFFNFSPMRKETLRKAELCLVTGCLIKPF